MTTNSVTSVKIDKRGKHPASLANLKPYQPGESGNKGNPYPITRQLKDILRDCKTSKEIAQCLIDTAKNPQNRSYVPAVKELLDRTEGKVPGDGVQVNFNEIKVLIVEAAPPAMVTTGENQ